MLLLGPHTAYLRNDNSTKVVIGDVYRAQQIKSSIDLKVGLVGIVIPHRVLVQGAFACSLTPAPPTIIAYPPMMVPHLLELPNSPPDKGYVFSPYFSLPVQNVFSHSINIEFSLEKPIGEDGNYFIREAKSHDDKSTLVIHTTIAPGQTINLPLQLTSSNVINAGQTHDHMYISCRENRPFHVILTPSKGQAVKVPVEFKCRKLHQSFLFSYLDHDDSIAQAGIVLPLDFHTPNFKTFGRPGSTRSKRKTAPVPNSDSCIDGTCITSYTADTKEDIQRIFGYPAILTLHGSGIQPQNHADAYKMMPPGAKEYLFGVEGYFVVAPSRFGAHNWEGVGDLSARSSLHILKHFLESAPANTMPKLFLENGIIAGHSMGGHGAWVTASNAPNGFSCALPGAGWIKKEEYSNSNAFYELDISSSFTDPELKVLLEKSLSEYHVDRLVSNMQAMHVHIRVGTHDNTVHPWFSRRMHRLLLQHNINSTLEEPLGKQHWWWDTTHENDGGVVNDPVMRNFYSFCLHQQYMQGALALNYSQYAAMQQDADSKITKHMTFRHWLAYKLDLVDAEGVSKKSKGAKKRLMLESQDEDHSFLHHDCERNLTMTLINPAVHEGNCGVQVLQQHLMLRLSSVHISCNHHIPIAELKICQITTGNVRRFTLKMNFGSTLFDADEIYINNHKFTKQDTKIDTKEIDICIHDSKTEICMEQTISPLMEKHLFTYGPIRRVYDRPFYIVYGTPPSQSLRVAMRDFAVYLGNAHFTSHHTYVQVISDLEFRSGNYMKRNKMANIVFVGDMHTNKLLRAIIVGTDNTAEENAKTKAPLPIKGRIPSDIQLLGYYGEEEIPNIDTNPNKRRAQDDVKADKEAKTQGFTLANVSYSGKDHAVVFTMPLYRELTSGSDAANNIAMGLCIHANTAQGYLHLSRLAWPVIPPMVRAPFANYLPDFVVINDKIWGYGTGGIAAAGYWDAEWKFDAKQAFVANSNA